MHTNQNSGKFFLTRETTVKLSKTLTWLTTGAEFYEAEIQYAGRVSNALSALLMRLRPEAPTLADELETRLTQASDNTICKVCLSPCVSRKLLWAQGSTIATANFVVNELQYEIDSADQTKKSHTTLAEESVVRQSFHGASESCQVRSRLAIAFEDLDLVEFEPVSPTPTLKWKPIEEEQRPEISKSIDRAYSHLCNHSPGLESLLDTCSKTVVVRQSNAGIFSSFSSFEYVGQMTLVNPQIVGETIIIESLVHEAIHSYLYMLEPTPFWGLSADISEVRGIVISPWTGRELSLCAFLHACFVWYGLFFFWGQFACVGDIKTDAVRKRMSYAGNGFTQDPIVKYLGRDNSKLVRVEVQNILEKLQNNVMSIVA